MEWTRRFERGYKSLFDRHLFFSMMLILMHEWIYYQLRRILDRMVNEWG
jgi:hypothetical protein